MIIFYCKVWPPYKFDQDNFSLFFISHLAHEQDLLYSGYLCLLAFWELLDLAWRVWCIFMKGCFAISFCSMARHLSDHFRSILQADTL